MRSKPHLVKDEMGEGARAKGKEPSFPKAPIEVYPNKGDKQKEKKSMAKYPTVTEDISEEELTYGFINNIRKKRADEQNPRVYTASKRSKLPYPIT